MLDGIIHGKHLPLRYRLALRMKVAEEELLLRAMYGIDPTTNPEGKINMNIGDAIECMRAGAKLTRRGWNGPAQWIALQTPDENSKMCKPYIYISPVDGELVPWLASQTDILADDWETVDV